MPSINDYFHALHESLGEKQFHFALRQLAMARDFLTHELRRELMAVEDNGGRLKLVDTWFGDFLAQPIKNTLVVLAQKSELSLLDKMPAIDGGDAVTVTTAEALSSELEVFFKKKLEEALGSTVISFKQDKGLIGGVLIRVGDVEIDHTLRTQLWRVFNT